MLGLNISDLLLAKNFELINKGAIAELFVGLEILKAKSHYQPATLYFWQREALNSSAEVDYLRIHQKITYSNKLTIFVSKTNGTSQNNQITTRLRSSIIGRA